VREYYWGSNGTVARICLTLRSAHRLSPKAEYLDTCVDQIAYLYGRNYHARSMVTQDGKDPPMSPHDRRSGGDAILEPYPGYLIGGPWPTAKHWQDVQSDYETNEVAINWNAALVYALAGFVEPGAWSGEGGAPTCGGPAAPYGEDDAGGPSELIDDVEDGDEALAEGMAKGGTWYSFIEPGAQSSGFEATEVDREGSVYAAHLKAGPTSEWGGGLGIVLNPDRGPFNACTTTGITFWAKGTRCGQPLQVRIADVSSQPDGKVCTACYDHFTTAVRLTEGWAKYTITWDAFTKAGWGKPQAKAIDLERMYQILFQWPTGAGVEFWVDDVAFTTARDGSSRCTSDGVGGAGGAEGSAGNAGSSNAGSNAGGAAASGASGVPAEDVAARGGCGCRLAGRPERPLGAGLLALLGLALLRRRGRGRPDA
jgi:hypothetical protein